MPVDPTRWLVAVVLAAGLLLSGCGGGDKDASGSPSGSASTSDDSLDPLISAGLQELDAGDVAAATRSFKAVLTLDPGNVYATYNLGYIAQSRGETGDAILRYTQALDTDPAFGPALYNLAILTEPSDLTAAVALYRRALAADPDNAQAHMRLGFALRHLGRKDEAHEELARGIQLDPAMANVESPDYGD